MMKKLLLMLFLIAIGFAGNAQFSGDFAPGNWSYSSTTVGGDGSVNISGAPSSIILNGSDNDMGGGDEQYSIVIANSGSISFSYTHVNPDIDNAYYIINGVETFIIDSGSGTNSGILVNSGDVFGFKVKNYDNCCGRGVLTISNFVFALVPTITNFPAANGAVGTGITLTDPTSNSAGAFTYSSSNTAVATVSGNVVTPITAGTTTITATQTASGNYTQGSISAVYTISSCTAPAITTQPIAKTVNYGTDTSFSVAATGTDLSYQWKKDNVNISGAIASTLSLTNVGTADGGSYSCVVTGTCGTVTSSVVDLNFNPIPVPTSMYATQIYAGDDKTLANLQITGTAIKWYDAAIAGSVLETTTVLVDGATYYATQTNYGVESTERLPIGVKRISDAEQNLATGSTVANLASTPSTGSKAVWNTAATSGTVLDNTAVLSSGTYYVSQELDKKFVGFSNISDLTIDNAGNIYVFANNVIKKIASDNTITNIAGSEGVNTSVNGTGTSASFSSGSHLTMGSDGNLYVAEVSAVKKVSLPGGVVTTLATGFANFGGGITSDGTGNLYVANTDASRVDKVAESTGAITTIPNAADYRVRAVAVDQANNYLYTALYNLGSGYSYLKRVNLTNNSVTNIGVIGNGKLDGTATTAQFKNITDIAFNNASQTLYVIDDATIRQVDVDLNVTTNSLYAGTTKLAINQTGTTFRATSSEVIQYNGLSNRTAVKVNLQPIVSTFLPANNAIDVVTTNDLKLTFNEAIVKGNGNITIYDAADDSVFETVEVTSSNVIIAGASVTINPSSNLLRSKTYYVLIDEAVFKNSAGNAFIGIASKTTWSFSTELKLFPTVTFANLSKTYGDATFDLAATSNSTGVISYEIVAGGTGSATLSGTNNNLVTLGNEGIVTLKATVAADANYNEGSRTVTLTIAKKAITVTAVAKTKVYGTADVVLTYVVAPNLVGTDVFTGSLSRVVGEDVGTYGIAQGTLSAGSNYLITFLGADFTISKADQQITWNQNLVSDCGSSASIVLTATSNSGLPISYTSSDSNVATVSNGVLNFVNYGSAIITASQSGNVNYNAATVVAMSILNSQPNLIRQQFEDVIFFDNSSNSFTAYSWYKNGVLVTGQTAQYFKDSEVLNGTYYAIATRTDGTVVTSCPLTFSPSIEQEFLKVAPNPVRSDSSYQLFTNINDVKLQNARITIFNLLGAQISDMAINSKTVDMIAPSAEGIYIVRLTLSNGKVLTKNLLVRN